jgi:hypothetical protein
VRSSHYLHPMAKEQRVDQGAQLMKRRCTLFLSQTKKAKTVHLPRHLQCP